MKTIIYHVDGTREQFNASLRPQITDHVGETPVSVSMIDGASVILKRADHEELEPNESFLDTRSSIIDGDIVSEAFSHHKGVVVVTSPLWVDLPLTPPAG